MNFEKVPIARLAVTETRIFMFTVVLSAKKCTSHIVLFDFLAPRLLSSSSLRKLLPSLVSPAAPSSIRSVSAIASSASRSSILYDVGKADPNTVNAELFSLRIAARNGDIYNAWNSYQSLVNRHLTAILGPPHYGPLSKMISKICEDKRAWEKWRKGHSLVMEEMALVCAHAGFTDGLRGLLLQNLACNKPEAVIRLYERYDQTEPEIVKRDLETTVDEEDIDPASVRFESQSMELSYARYIVVSVIAAHALRDSFVDALSLILRHREYRIVPQTVKYMFQDLKQCGGLEAKTREYCEAAGMAALVQRPEAFKAHIRNLSKEVMAAERLKKIADALLAGLDGPLPWASLDEANRSPARPVVITDKVWSYVLKALIQIHREDMAEALWSEILDRDIVPGIDLWNGLLEGYRVNRQTQKLLNAWEVMRTDNIPFNARSYGSKIICLLENGARGGAFKAFDEFKKVIPDSAESMFVYNSLLDSFLRQNDMKAATTFLDDMAKRGLSWDTVTYNIFIKYYGKKGDLKSIAGIVDRLTENGAQPDVFTFTTILSAMLRANVPNATARLLEVMKTMKVEENVATYSAIIDSQVQYGSADGIRSAWEILQRMEAMKNVQPNEITYTSFLVGLHRSSELDKTIITNVSDDIVEKMKKRGVRLTRGMFHILFKACLDNPSQNGLSFFMTYYSMMQRKKIPFAHDTWYIILKGLQRRGEWALASELMEQMLRSNFQPMWGVLDMVIQIRRWQASQGM